MSNRKNLSVVALFFVGLLFYLYSFFMQISPGVIAEEVKIDLLTSNIMFLNASAMFFYSYAFMQIPVGLIFAKFGVKRVLLIAMIISTLSTLLFARSANIYAFAGSRFILGFGTSFAYIGVLLLAGNLFKTQLFPLLIGLAELMACLGGLLANIPLNSMINNYGWRISMLFFGVSISLCAIFFIFLRHNFKSQPYISTPLLKPLKSVLTNKIVLKTSFLAFLIFLPVMGFIAYWAEIYLIKNYHFSHSKALAECSLVWLTSGCFSPIIGWLSSYLNSRIKPLLFCLTIGLISLSTLLLLKPTSAIMVGFLMVGIGISASSLILPFAIANDYIPKKKIATAFGIINFGVVISAPFGQLLIGLLVKKSLFGLSLDHALWFLLASYIFAAFIGLSLRTSGMVQTRVTN